MHAAAVAAFSSVRSVFGPGRRVNTWKKAIVAMGQKSSLSSSAGAAAASSDDYIVTYCKNCERR